jgi:hypothetical protein
LDGAEQCASVTAVADQLVDSMEEFTVVMTLVTAGANLSLGNSVTTVTITDVDGNTL